jgi:hypothetical protein
MLYRNDHVYLVRCPSVDVIEYERQQNQVVWALLWFFTCLMVVTIGSALI